MAIQNADSVAITGGTLTDVRVSTGTYSSRVNETLMKKVRKASAGTISKGQAVYIVGSTGTHLTVELADASSEITAATTIGVAAETITNTADAYMIVSGLLTGLSTLPTASFINGSSLWLSETAGDLTTTRPTQPAHSVAMGWVVNASNGASGSAYIKVINGQELEELHDVLIVSATANDVLMYDTATSLWKNRSAGFLSTYITGFASASHVHSTGDITSGIFAPSFLGSGSPSITTFLRGDGQWATVTGGSGANYITVYDTATASAGPYITWQRLPTNQVASQSNSATIMFTTTSVGTGTWQFDYHVVYQSAATTTGTGMHVNHTGASPGTFVSMSRYLTTGGTAATGVVDQVASGETTGLLEGKGERVLNTRSSLTRGVDTANANVYTVYSGLLVVTNTGDLQFKVTSEVNGSNITVQAGSFLELKKIA